MRLESSQNADRGERGVAMFDDVSHGFAIVALGVGCPHLFGGENASELEGTVGWVNELGPYIDARVHQTDELGRVDLRAWNMDIGLEAFG